MIDREKVIKEFDDAKKEFVWLDNEYTVGYNDGIEAGKNIALALLKENGAVEPIKMQRMDDFSYFVSYFLCGNCRYELEGKDVMFCAHCGRPVKWDDTGIRC